MNNITNLRVQFTVVDAHVLTANFLSKLTNGPIRGSRDLYLFQTSQAMKRMTLLYRLFVQVCVHR